MHFNRKYSLNENYFEKIDTEDKAYWLGFMYADGNVYIHPTKKGVSSITLSSHIKDEHHIKKFANALETDKPFYYEKRWDCCELRIYSFKMLTDLINLGCTPRKSFTIEFPNVNQVPENLQNHFIRGYHDGDGSVWMQKKSITLEFTCGSFDFLRSINKKFNENLGVFRPIKYNSNKNCFSLRHTRHSHVFKIFNYYYNNASIFLERKYELTKDIVNASFL